MSTPDEAERMAQLRKNTTVQRAIPIAVATLQSMEHIAKFPATTRMGRPLAGKTVIVVGAGPSLDKNAALVKELRANRKALVFAINNSAPALKKQGIPIDALVLIESLDVTKHVLDVIDGVDHLVMDASTHVAHWALADWVNRASWFTAHAPHNIRFCLDTGIAPIGHGGSSSSAAICVALAWGARRIVLVGHDLSYSGGRAYADGAGWDGLEYTEDAEGNYIFTGRPDRDELHRAHGVSPVPRKRMPTKVPGWDGGVAFTTLDYLNQIRWLEKIVRRHPGVEFMNATEGGARTEGWRHVRLDGVKTHIDDDPPAPPASVPHLRTHADAIRLFVSESIGRALATESMAQEILGGTTGIHDAPGLINSNAYAELMAAPDTVRLKDNQELSGSAKVEALYVAIRTASQKVRAILSDQLARM